MEDTWTALSNYIHVAPKKGENRGLPWGSSLRQSWNTAPNAKMEDTWTALSNNIHVAPKKGVNGGLPWGCSLRQSWNIATNSIMEDTWTALNKNIHVSPKKLENGGLPWRSSLRQSWNTAPNSKSKITKMRVMQTKSSKQNIKLSSIFFENYNIKRQTLNEIWDPINFFYFK